MSTSDASQPRDALDTVADKIGISRADIDAFMGPRATTAIGHFGAFMRGDLDLEGLAVAVGYVNQNPDAGGASDWVWLRDTEDATEDGPGWDDLLIAESLADLHADLYLSVPVAKVPAFAAWVNRIAAALVPGEDQPQRPAIVCLCGSTRFWREFQRVSLAETLAGRIVLSIGAASGTDDESFGNLPPDEYQRIKEELDQLHLRKVEMADEVLILNCGGYVGESTARELAHAYALGKRIRFLEPEMGKVNYALKRAAEAEHPPSATTTGDSGATEPPTRPLLLGGKPVDLSTVRCADVSRKLAIGAAVEVLDSAPEPGTRGLRGAVLRWECRDGAWWYTVLFGPGREEHGFWTIAEPHLQAVGAGT